MRRKGEKGQSTIEFLLTFSLLFGIVFFYFKFALFLGASSFIQYATFMSARAYQASSVSSDDQTTRAKAVLTRLLTPGEGREGQDRWPGILMGKRSGQSRPHGAFIGPGPNASQTDDAGNYSWQIGVRYVFRSRLLSLLPGGEDLDWTEFTSEAWLGRAPSYQDCLQKMQEINGDQPLVIDNGC